MRGEHGRTEWDLRVDKFEEMMAVANEAQVQAMMWMARVMEKRVHEAEHGTEGAKEETAAFERAILEGPEAMVTALPMLGEMGLGGSTGKMSEKEDDWESVRSQGMANRCKNEDGEREPNEKSESTEFERGCTIDGVGNQLAGEVRKGDGLVSG